MNRTLALMLGFALLLSTALVAQDALTGRWEGETESGRLVQLNVKTVQKALTGTITIDKKPATISEGTVTKEKFSFKAPMGGHLVLFSGRVAKDEVELKHEGARNPVVLKRMK